MKGRIVPDELKHIKAAAWLDSIDGLKRQKRE
jgi:hypothetical protein